MASLLWPAVPVWAALVAWAVAGFGIGIAYSPISLTALGWARPGNEGRVSASVQLCDVLGTALGNRRGRGGGGDRPSARWRGPASASAWPSPPRRRWAMVGLAVTPRLPARTSPDRRGAGGSVTPARPGRSGRYRLTPAVADHDE